MLDLTLFRSGTYAGANVAMLLVALAMFGVFFFVSLYMQNILGYSAVQAGAAFLPMTMLIILVAPIAGKASDKYGSRWLMTIGMVLLGVQLLYLSQLGADASFWNLLPGFLVGGLGMAMTMTPTAAAATRAVPVEKSGVGSAVLNAMRQVGGSVGIALMGAIVAAADERTSRRRGLHGRLRASALRRRVDRVRRLDRRLRARPQEAASGGARADGGRSLSTLVKTRLPAAERRQAIVDAAMRSSSTEATAARRRRTSPVRPVSRSRSSTATSLPSASSTSRASTRRGSRCARRWTRSSTSSATSRRSPRSARLARIPASGGIKPRDALDPGAD